MEEHCRPSCNYCKSTARYVPKPDRAKAAPKQAAEGAAESPPPAAAASAAATASAASASASAAAAAAGAKEGGTIGDLLQRVKDEEQGAGAASAEPSEEDVAQILEREVGGQGQRAAGGEGGRKEAAAEEEGGGSPAPQEEEGEGNDDGEEGAPQPEDGEDKEEGGEGEGEEQPAEPAGPTQSPSAGTGAAEGAATAGAAGADAGTAAEQTLRAAAGGDADGMGAGMGAGAPPLAAGVTTERYKELVARCALLQQGSAMQECLKAAAGGREYSLTARGGRPLIEPIAPEDRGDGGGGGESTHTRQKRLADVHAVFHTSGGGRFENILAGSQSSPKVVRTELVLLAAAAVACAWYALRRSKRAASWLPTLPRYEKDRHLSE